ncbi:hypothetical protein SHL15_8881 [Streptomyces hygroscopicus subsp. limoneus]|nr:hypothetical protein SHL15_8881 [Streptomyces hygroscopicus subsp. limoneus]
MKSFRWKTIVTTAAIAGMGGLAIAAAPTQAASSAVGGHPVSNVQAHEALSPQQLSALPLTNRHLTRHEIANLAVVLNAYHVAEGNSLDVEAFVNSFTKDGVFDDKVAGATYQGKALGDVLNRMVSLFPDVHRELKSITVNDDEISIELAIQGTFKGALQTPAGTVKPTGARVDTPTADFWYLRDGKVKRFDCYVGYTKMYSDMGVNLDWASAVAGK